MSAWSTAKPIKWAEMARQIRHRDSIESKVIGFFDTNPEEELAVSDVVLKYGATMDTVSKLMRGLVSKGLLEKRQEGRLHLYRKANITEAA